MDVRSVDTSSLAAQRAEMEQIQPSKERTPFILSRITSRTAQDAGGRVGRSKSSTEREGEQEEREHEQSAATTPAESEAEVEAQAVQVEEHILDVRV